MFADPDGPAIDCGSSSHPVEPSVYIALTPSGNSIGNWCKDLGRGASKRGYNLGSFGWVGGGMGGNGTGAYEVVVTVVVVTLAYEI